MLFVSVVKSPIYDEPYLLHFLQESELSDILEAMLSLASSKGCLFFLKINFQPKVKVQAERNYHNLLNR